jgi:ribosomal protein S4E
MKKVQSILFEKGDHVKVTSGYNKGKVGTVVRHASVEDSVEYQLFGKEYDTGDDWDDESEESKSKFLEYITKAEYDKTLVDLKMLSVPGLAVSIQFKGKTLLIGDNVITEANAKKISEFINKHTTATKSRRK